MKLQIKLSNEELKSVLCSRFNIYPYGADIELSEAYYWSSPGAGREPYFEATLETKEPPNKPVGNAVEQAPEPFTPYIPTIKDPDDEIPF